MPKTSYNLTAEGYDRVEAGLPYKSTPYYLTLGAIADLEERHGGRLAIGEREILELTKYLSTKSLQLALKRLVRNGLIETTTC